MLLAPYSFIEHIHFAIRNSPLKYTTFFLFVTIIFSELIHHNLRIFGETCLDNTH